MLLILALARLQCESPQISELTDKQHPFSCHSGGTISSVGKIDSAANGLLLAAQSRAKAVVIGGGLLGLEAAAGLKARDMDVTVLHLMPTLMERQLDPAATTGIR